MPELYTQLKQLPPERLDYLLSSATLHLTHRQQKKTLRHLLTRYGYLKARLESAGIQALIADLQLASNDASVALIMTALRNASYFLEQDYSQLAGQLIGRLKYSERQTIQSLLTEAARTEESGTWLEPQSSSLPRPDARLLSMLTQGKNSYVAIAVSADEKHLVVGSRDKTVTVWDIESGYMEAQLEGHTQRVRAVAFTQDGRIVLSASRDHTVRVWDWQSERQLLIYEGHSERIWAVKHIPNSTLAISCSYDKSIQVWDFETGKLAYKLMGHEKSVRRLDVNPSGTLALSGSSDRTVRLWDLQKQICLLTLDNLGDWIRQVRFVPGNEQLAVILTRSKALYIWDLLTGKVQRKIDVRKAYGSDGHSFHLSSDGQFIAIGGSYEIDIATFPDLTHVEVLRGHNNTVFRQAFIHNNERLISAGGKDIRIWQVQNLSPSKLSTGRPTDHDKWIKAFEVLDNGSQFWSVSNDGSAKLWDAEQMVCLQTVNHGTDVARSITFNSSHNLLVIATKKGIQIHNPGRGSQIDILLKSPPAEGDMVSRPYALRGVLFFNEHAEFLSYGNNKQLQVWDAQTGVELRRVVFDSAIFCVRLSPCGGYLVVGGRSAEIQAIDAQTFKPLWKLSGHENTIRDFMLTADGRKLVSCSADATIRIWDIESKKCLKVLYGHRGFVNALALTSDDQHIVSISSDGSVRVWEIATGTQVASFSDSGELHAVAILADGTILCGGKTRMIHQLRFHQPL